MMDRSSPKPAPRRVDELPAAGVAEKRRSFPIVLVWLVPVIAAAAGGALAFQALFLTGPHITIRFEDGTGLGGSKQTMLRYHGVDCGTVDSVALADNHKDVIVRATLKREATDFAREGTHFWIVRPEVSIIGVRGLETLMSGPYIQVLPGKGPEQTKFTGLTNAPPPDTLDPGLDIVLESDRRGALRVGSPVYYREVEVGKVKSYALARSADAVAITVHIDAAHAALVHTNSRFRNVSGLRMSIGMHGVNLDLESIESLMAGGVAFETPAGDGTPAKDGTVFQLYETPADDAAVRKAGLRITVAAEHRSGVDVGAPVLFRGVQVGEVEKLRLAPDARWVHIGVRIEPGYRTLVRRGSKFWNVSGVKIDVGLLGAKADIDSLQSALGGGIEFATPNDLGDAVTDGAVFFLYDKPDPTWKEWAPEVSLAATAGDDKPGHDNAQSPARKTPPGHVGHGQRHR